MKNSISKWAIFSVAAAAFTLSGCSSEESATPGDGIRVASRLAGDATEASYTHTIALFKAGSFVEKKDGASASFKIDNGDNVFLRATAAGNANVNFGSYLENDGVGLIELTDLTNVPDVLVGKSAAKTVSASEALPISMERLVSKITFSVTADASITAVTATVQNAINKISPMNKKGIPAAGLTQSVILTKDTDGLFKGSSLIAPSANGATSFDVVFDVTFSSGSGMSSETRTLNETLNANRETIVAETITVNGQPISAGAREALSLEASNGMEQVVVSDAVDLTKF